MIRYIGISIASKNDVEQDAVERAEHAVHEPRHGSGTPPCTARRDSVITSQPAHTTSTVMKLFSSTNSTRDAVDAQVVVDVEARDPVRVSRRTASPSVVVSKWTYSGIVTRNPATAPISAIQRATSRASRSRPTPSTATPATIGTQIASERYGVVTPSPRSQLCAATHAPPVQQHEDADDHRERVVVDVARLDAAHQRRNQADEPRRAVDEEPSMIVRSPTFEANRPTARAPPAKNQSLNRSK